MNGASLEDRTLCTTTAHLLAAAAASAGALGLGAAAGAAGLLLWKGLGPAAWALALVPVERALALRLRFDAGLFAALAQHAGTPTLAALDRALTALGLRAEQPATRALPERVRGALRLIVWHGVAVVVQCGALLLDGATR
jgi:hypothetical protein